jgi:hypothetical protein
VDFVLHTAFVGRKQELDDRESPQKQKGTPKNSGARVRSVRQK